MKTVILAGGLGTRISEESHLRPKPMIEIGGMPILWHIMKIYSHYGFNEFIICLGYKGNTIKDFFANYFLYTSDVTFDFMSKNEMIVHNNASEPWKVTLVDTGISTMTGGRIKRIRSYVDNDTFMMTYGDGVSDVNLKELYDYHKSHGKLATLTAIQPAGRYGAVDISEDNAIKSFEEKPQGDDAWVNGGFFVLNKKIFDYIESDNTSFEKEPLEKMAEQGQLVAYKHHGFWQSMDTMRDKQRLEQMWVDEAPWRKW